MQDILFNEAEHRYYDANGRNYTSVTTIIEKYAPLFDKDFWSMFTALKNNGFKVKPVPETKSIYCNNSLNKLSDLKKDSLFKLWQQEVLTKWEIITEEACIRGNNTHNDLEDSINISKGDNKGTTNSLILPHIEKQTIKTTHDLDKTNLKEKYPFVYKRLNGYLERNFSIFAEKRVFLEEYLVAGMIDVPLIKENYFAILDWKTNKDELHDTAGYYKKRKVAGVWIKTDEWVSTDDCLNYPLNNIPASKFHKYALQLSLYAYILECWGYKLLDKGLEIIHFPLNKEPKLIKIPYLKNEVIIMLNHHKNNLLINQL
jgi:hypothetical protein